MTGTIQVLMPQSPAAQEFRPSVGVWGEGYLKDQTLLQHSQQVCHPSLCVGELVAELLGPAVWMSSQQAP